MRGAICGLRLREADAAETARLHETMIGQGRPSAGVRCLAFAAAPILRALADSRKLHERPMSRLAQQLPEWSLVRAIHGLVAVRLGSWWARPATSRDGQFIATFVVPSCCFVFVVDQCVKAGEKVHQWPERKCISWRGRGNRGLASGRGSARETVCEVNRQRSMIGAELEQTNEFGVEALR